MTFKVDSIEFVEDAPPAWRDYDFSKPSHVVIAAPLRDDDCAILWAVGGHLLFEMDETGFTHPSDLGLNDPPGPGIWVWTGKYVWHRGPYECPADGETLPEGEWRRPTDEEWESIKRGECPWDDEDWKLPANKLQADK